MGYIIIDRIKNNNKKIMIFAEGTILKPKHNNIFSKRNVLKYVPIGKSIEILRNWQEQGFEIIYLTSLTGKGAMNMARRLDELGFEGSMVGYRQKNQDYGTLLKEEVPDILIEDNCKTRGMKEFMCYSYIETLPIASKIKHIVVEEFEGIDNVDLYKE